MKGDQFVFWESSIIFTNLHAMFFAMLLQYGSDVIPGVLNRSRQRLLIWMGKYDEEKHLQSFRLFKLRQRVLSPMTRNTIIFRQIYSFCIKATSVPTGKPAAYRDAVLASKYALGHCSLNPCIKLIWRWDVRTRNTGHITIRW